MYFPVLQRISKRTNCELLLLHVVHTYINAVATYFATQLYHPESLACTFRIVNVDNFD